MTEGPAPSASGPEPRSGSVSDALAEYADIDRWHLAVRTDASSLGAVEDGDVPA